MSSKRDPLKSFERYVRAWADKLGVGTFRTTFKCDAGDNARAWVNIDITNHIAEYCLDKEWGGSATEAQLCAVAFHEVLHTLLLSTYHGKPDRDAADHRVIRALEYALGKRIETPPT